jgi:hypothetical protein
MITHKQIPDEARAAAKRAYFKATHLSWQDAIDAAMLEMLNAWPGVQFKMNGAMRTFLILPLTQEPRT